jgi:iron complex transport system substrate-binding protein
MKKIKSNQLFIVLILLLVSPIQQAMAQASPKIVSVNGTISEILAGIGMEANIIGTDVTSNYPETLKNKPKVGHNRNLSAEGILALQPEIVTGLATEVKPELVAQLKSTGIKLVLFNQTFSAEGTRKLIREVAQAFGKAQMADPLIKKLDADLAGAAKVIKTTKKQKVLFIYARGTGTMMVAGEGTQMAQIIEMAGGVNAVSGFTDFKPLTPEALVAANPDVILLFSSGMQSLGGTAGLLNVQGVNQTNAGKNKRFITMDGELLSSFGPRLGLAVNELAQKVK